MVLPGRGRTALITGASSGIGLACAQRFNDLGVRVAISARRRELLEKLASSLTRDPVVIEADVSDEGSAKEALSKVWERFGRLDYVVHAAGIVEPAPIEALTGEVWRRHIDVNLTGAFYIMREAALIMRAQGNGSIVAIASDLSLVGLQNYAHYCASKAGLIGMAKAFALELAPLVRVNCICPGPVDTPMMESELKWFGGTAEVRQGAVAAVPMKRFASPEEIAKFAVFVAMDMEFATGSILSIDGGTTAR